MLCSEGRLLHLEDRSKALTVAQAEIEQLTTRVKELEDFIEAEGRCLLVPLSDSASEGPSK